MCYSAHALVGSVYFLFIPECDVTDKAGCLPYKLWNPLHLRTTQSQTRRIYRLWRHSQTKLSMNSKTSATSETDVWIQRNFRVVTHPQNKVCLNHGTLGVSQIRNQTNWCHDVTHKPSKPVLWRHKRSSILTTKAWHPRNEYYKTFVNFLSNFMF
jgi:hypothetical protein